MSRKNRDSFILYTGCKQQIAMLSDQDAGRLFKALFEFVDNGTEPDFSDSGALYMCFSFISAQVLRDKEKYDDICEKRAAAGKKGGRQKQANIASATNAKQKQANLADNENDSDSENETGTNKMKYSKDFEMLWEIYPRKIDKGQAYKKYEARLRDGYSPEELIRAVRNYKEQCDKQKTDQRFIKHAKTFFGDALPFTDYIAQPQATNCNYNNDDPYAIWRE